MFLQRSNGTVLDTAFFLSSLRTSCSPIVLTGLLMKIQLLAVSFSLRPLSHLRVLCGEKLLTAKGTEKIRKVRGENLYHR
jgi:hypothetical protein